MSTQTIPTTALVPQVSEEQIQAIESGRNGLLTRALELTINSLDTEQIGWSLINGIADLKKSIVDDFKAPKALAAAAHKAICAQENGHLDKLKEPDAIVRQKLSAWADEKRRIQQEEEHKAREAAEAERKRLQAIADEEARAAQERLRAEAEERRLREAIEAEAAGQGEVAAAILERPVEVIPVIAPVVIAAPVVVPAVLAQKVEGAGSMVENWYHEVVNPALVPDEYKTINEQAIAKVTKALKGATKIPGVKVFSRMEPRTSARR